MIRCPKCGHENVPDAQNCANCHVNLAYALANPEAFRPSPPTVVPAALTKAPAVNTYSGLRFLANGLVLLGFLGLFIGIFLVVGGLYAGVTKDRLIELLPIGFYLILGSLPCFFWGSLTLAVLEILEEVRRLKERQSQ